MVKFIYKLFIGVLLAVTIGMGIETFYPAPPIPEYPAEKYPHSIPVEDKPTPADLVRQEKYDREYKIYNEKREEHSRNTSMIIVVLSLLILVAGMTVLANVDVITDGLMLGGIFTLLYGIVRSFGTGDQKFVFMTTLIGLIVALVLGYFNFVKNQKIVKTKKK